MKAALATLGALVVSAGVVLGGWQADANGRIMDSGSSTVVQGGTHK